MKKNSKDIISNDIKEIIDDISKFSKNFVLLVGGKGFLGTYFLKTISAINKNLDNPVRVLVIDNLITAKNKEEITEPNVEFIQFDISKMPKIEGEIDYIIHAASIASPIVYRKFPIKTIDVNYQGTRNILELAKEKKSKSVLFLSSSEIYGDPQIIPTPESYWGHVSSVGPRACYDESKRLAETICINYWQQYGVAVKIVRPFNVYGPYLNLDDGRVIPDFMKNAIQKSQIIIHSDGKPTRSFCYVTDAMRAFFRVLFLAPAGSIFNVGNDEEVSVLTLAENIRELIDKSIEIKLEKSEDPNYTQDNPTRRCPDLTKVKKEVDYSPSVGLKEGLNRIYGWYSEVSS